MSHTKEPWHVAIGNGTMVIANRVPAIATTIGDECRENARRIVACVNACAGIPTEKIEGKTIADYVTSEAFLTGMTVVDGVNMGIKGLACQMLAEKFAGQFVGNGAVNFLEVTMVSEETGPLIVTIQRKHGKTPAQLKAEAEQQRDEALARCVRLERELERANGFHERLAEQRDDLLAVLRSMFNEHGEFDLTIAILSKARAIIAKAEAKP